MKEGVFFKEVKMEGGRGLASHTRTFLDLVSPQGVCLSIHLSTEAAKKESEAARDTPINGTCKCVHGVS